MADIFNEHFRDFIRALNDNKVQYVIVGGIAVILHGYVRGRFRDLDDIEQLTKE